MNDTSLGVDKVEYHCGWLNMFLGISVGGFYQFFVVVGFGEKLMRIVLLQ